MNKLIGIKWGMLEKETKQWLLESSNCVDENCNNVDSGDCIVDLTETLSISGKIVDSEIIIDNDEIIYNPENGVIEAEANINFEINEVMTVNEAAEKWNITEGAIRAAIKARKFVLGVDYRKAGRITLITRNSMIEVYGNASLSKINRMTVKQFINELTEENYDYINEKYQSIERALEIYQEGAQLGIDGEYEEYLSVNEYFNETRDSDF